MKLKTVDIKGKDYVPVTEKVKYFRSHEDYKGWQMVSSIISLDASSVTIETKIINNEGVVIGYGFANENIKNGFINKTSMVENCETSAWGRALSNIGIGIDTSIASAEEVATAINGQNKINNNTKITEEALTDLIKKCTTVESIEQLSVKMRGKVSHFTAGQLERIKECSDSRKEFLTKDDELEDVQM